MMEGYLYPNKYSISVNIYYYLVNIYQCLLLISNTKKLLEEIML